MKVILERHDILRIVAEHFDSDIENLGVVIHTDPLELEVTVGLPPSEKRKAVAPVTAALPTAPPEPRESLVIATHVTEEEAELIARRADGDASGAPPPPGIDDTPPRHVRDAGPAALLAQSRQLEAELDRQNPTLARRKGGQPNPPAFSKDEVT